MYLKTGIDLIAESHKNEKIVAEKKSISQVTKKRFYFTFIINLCRQFFAIFEKKGRLCPRPSLHQLMSSVYSLHPTPVYVEA